LNFVVTPFIDDGLEDGLLQIFDDKRGFMSSKEAEQKPVVSGLKKKSVPAGLWTKCPSCGNVMFNKALKENASVCTKCDYHFMMKVQDRLQDLLDPKSFKELYAGLASQDPLRFQGPKTYAEKLKQDQKKTGLKEACITGEAKIDGIPVAISVTDARFIMGSMGSVVGEKITRLIEHATEKKMSLIILSGSGGGARMYEGALSLMQMAKTCTALSRFQKGSKPYISILTNPTMGGVMASYASLGDVIIAEPKALIGFAGPRVIEQTIRQKLPHDFQTSEFLLEHGMLDMVVSRQEMRKKLILLLSVFR
jgi:acetyl-CoA carboxylase carboxyl transferase subunit beta